MSHVTDSRGQVVNFFVDDVEVQSVSGTDFDPYNSGSPTASDKARYLNKGFLVRPVTDGPVSVVTWANYKDNGDVVVDANVVVLTGCINSKWEEVRVVKVFDAGTTPTSVMIGVLA